MRRDVWIDGLQPSLDTGFVANFFLRYLNLPGANVWEWDNPSHHSVTVPGTPTNPWSDARESQPDRWVGFWRVDGGPLRITTRSQDGFTNDLVTGFARRFAARYGARVEEKMGEPTPSDR